MRREQSALRPPLVEPDCWAPERLLLDPVAKWSELTENIEVHFRVMMVESPTKSTVWTRTDTDVKNLRQQALVDTGCVLKVHSAARSRAIGSFSLLG